MSFTHTFNFFVTKADKVQTIHLGCTADGVTNFPTVQMQQVLGGECLSERWLERPYPELKPTAEHHFGLVCRLRIDRLGGWPQLQEMPAVLAVRAVTHGVDAELAQLIKAFAAESGVPATA